MTISCAALSALPLKRPCSPDFDPTASFSPGNALVHKRQRIGASPRRLPPPCPLQELPVEILQQIFFAALNGNLLRASPKIGLKLSIQSVYRTAFFVAFYHQNLADLRKMYTYLLPEIPLLIPYWELRSMVKIVLDSQWCTWHWFKELYLDLLGHALDRFDQTPGLEQSENCAETRRRIKDRSADCYGFAGRAIHGLLKDGRMFELYCSPYDICISEYPAELPKEEAGTIHKIVATKEWRLPLFAFGTIPMEGCIPQCGEGEKKPFREAFKGVFQLEDTSRTRDRDDVWGFRERCLYAAVQGNDIHTLRRCLQIDYFFYPEDVPYKISTNLFRAAVKSDCRDSEGLPPMSALAVLFDLDPQSLPYDSAIIKEWAQFNIDRICISREEVLQSFSYLKSRQADDIQFSESAARNYVRETRVAAYMDKTYRDIIRYMRDGVVPEEKNLLAPSFRGPKTGWGNVHQDFQSSGYSEYYHYGDKDLESLLAFVRSLPDVNSNQSDSLFENELIEDGASEEEDGVLSDEEEDAFSSGEESYDSYNPNLDYVPELVDKYGGALDRKTDYVWFQDPT